MVEINVKYAPRFKKRQAMKAIKKDYRKALAELITNSDDSYKRLESTAKTIGDDNYVNKVKTINIYFNIKKHLFEVVDFAEGLTKEEMAEIFEEYGKERETHFAAGRALFGQGLFDVMYCTNSGGEIHSFKDREFHFGKARWRGNVQKFIIDDKKTKADKRLRKKYKVDDGCGTNVSFFFKAKRLNFEKVYKELCEFYMLRFINSDPKREVNIIFLDGKKVINTETLKYSFPSGKKIDEIKKVINLEGSHKITINGELNESGTDLQQGGINRAGGLLIYDQKFNVYDLTLFSYDPHPDAKRFWGKVEMFGLKEYLLEKLKENEEILTDSRDGFDKNHPFYEEISGIFDEWIGDVIDEKKRISEINKSKKLRKKDKRALTLLNEIYDDINKSLTEGGPIKRKKTSNKMYTEIKFDRNNTVIDVDKEESVYLFINMDMVEEEDCVYVKSDNSNINIFPEQIVIKKGENKKISRHPITLTGRVSHDDGIVTATCRDTSTHLYVSILENVPFVPKNGIEFNPKKYSSKDTRANRVYLYIDLSKVELNEYVSFTGIDKEIIVPAESSVKISSEEFPIDNNIMKLSTLYRGYGVGKTGLVIAEVGGYSDEAEVKIVEREKPSGIFEKYTFLHMGDWVQSFFHKKNKEIQINLDHNINREYFGKIEEDAFKSVEEDPRAQMLLSEILLWECLLYSVKKSVMKIGGSSDFKFIMDYFLELKKYYGVKIFKIYVK